MEMDFTALLTSHFLAVVVLACLVVGYIIKHASFCKRINNDDIPVILAVLWFSIWQYLGYRLNLQCTVHLWVWLPPDCIRDLKDLSKVIQQKELNDEFYYNNGSDHLVLQLHRWLVGIMENCERSKKTK